MISKLIPLTLVACLSVAAPAFAMGTRPAETPAPAAAADGPTSLADMEAAAGHVLVLGPRITFETAKGSFTVVTFPKEAPKSVAQIVSLAESGFYDGIAFHRVVPGFVVQAGDPKTKTLQLSDKQIGKGGSGQSLPPEFQGQTTKHLVGTLGMARSAAPNSADSQFYVTLAATPHLDTNYTIWGQVIAGMDTLRQIEPGDKILKATVTGKPAAPKASGSAAPTP